MVAVSAALPAISAETIHRIVRFSVRHSLVHVYTVHCTLLVMYGGTSIVSASIQAGMLMVSYNDAPAAAAAAPPPTPSLHLFPPPNAACP